MIKYLIAFMLFSSPCLAGMGIGGFPYPGPGVVAASGGISISCTGTNSVLSGETEDFEFGAGDTCSSDWSAPGGGIDTYSAAQAKFGSHSMRLTDRSDVSNGQMQIDHGTAQTTKYYRFYLYITTSTNYVSFRIGGVGKYSTIAVEPIILINSGSAEGDERLKFATGVEYFQVTVGTWVRVELKIDDTDGPGSGYRTQTLRVYDSAGNPILTSNGGADYEVSSTGADSTWETFQYFIFSPYTTSATEQVVEIDGFKVCGSDWCGAE